MRKAIYRERDGWVLGQCSECGRLNYVEPHGTTATCVCPGGGEWTMHLSIPMENRDESGCVCISRPFWRAVT